MKSPTNFVKNKINNVDEFTNRNNNFKIEIKYVSSLANNIESASRIDNNMFSEKYSSINENEISSISNFKFLNSVNNRNTSSKISSATKKRSIESSLFEQQIKQNHQTPRVKFKLPDINTKENIKSKSKLKSCSSFVKRNSKTKNNDCHSSNETIKPKKPKFLDVKKPQIGQISKTPKTCKNHTKIISFNNNNNNEIEKQTRRSLFLNYVQDYSKSPKYKRGETKNEMFTKTNINYDYYNDIEKLFKINENIQNELESKELEKKVNLMKKTIVQSDTSDLIKMLCEEEDISSENENKKKMNLENNDSHNKYVEKSSEISIDEKNSHKKYEKYRKLKRIKGVYDSFDDEEYEEQNEIDYYIPPSCYFIKIYDCIMFLSAMYYLIFVPIYLSKDMILSPGNDFKFIILTLIDIIYIVDIIINFFRAYQNFDENLVRNTKYIIFHYIQTWFFLDFIQSIPFYTILKYIEKRCIIFNKCSPEPFNIILYLIILIKTIKVYKIIKENSTLAGFEEILSENEFFDNYGYIIISIFYSVSFLNLCACIYIFIGKHSHPGWISKINIQNEAFINKYVASVYFILVTITTVGYGDITGNSYPEIVYQMFLLIIGTLSYSFIISFISNYIIKKNQKSMTFEKNVGILKEIKIHNPHLKDSVYQEVLKNLHNEQLYERKDKSILFDCLPYTLKNKLIMEMYKPFIRNFVFFKENENSDFIVKVVTALKPLLSFKNDILIQEGDFIKEIFFVKKGVLLLNICIDRQNVEDSLKKYLGRNEFGTITISYVPSLMRNTSIMNLDDNLYNYFLNKKQDKKLVISNETNMQDIKIIEIRKNEHFGDALMFLNERCPLVVKVKTKIAELLILRKMEAIEIYSIYPNIWKRINKKSLFNMEQIKLKIQKQLIHFAKRYGTKAEKNILEKSKSLKRFLTLKSFQNESKDGLNENDGLEQKDIYYENNYKNDRNLDMHIIEEVNENINENQNDDDSLNKEKDDIYENKRVTINNEYDNILNEPKKKSFISEGKNKIENQLEQIKKTIFLKKNEIEIGNLIKSPSIPISSKNIDQKQQFQGNEEINKKKINKKILKYKSIPSNLNYNNDNSSLKPKISSNLLKKNSDFKFTNTEKIIFETFLNLSITNEKSFQLSSSYENINKITKNKYIKNHSLQSKTKQFLINECSTYSSESFKNNNLLKKNRLTGKVKLSKDTGTLTDELDLDDNKSVNSLDLNKLKSNKNNNNFDINNDKEKKLGEFKIQKHESNKNIFEKRNSKTNIFNLPYKSRLNKKRRKSEYLNVNKKLNLITKNIKGANKNINNPEEFYMDFFNNIISKNTGVLEEKKDEKKNSNVNSPQKKLFNFSEKNSPTQKKIFNSMISSEEGKSKKFKIPLKSTKKFNL